MSDLACCNRISEEIAIALRQSLSKVGNDARDKGTGQ